MLTELQCIHLNFSLFLLIPGVTLATVFLPILRHNYSSLCTVIFLLLPFRIIRPCYGMDVSVHSKATRNCSFLLFLGLTNGRRSLRFSSNLFNETIISYVTRRMQ